jgi:hypothetical protein
MSIIREDEYELSSNTEIDMLLSDLPLELIKENLRQQITDPLSTNVNYVEIIEDKLREMRNMYGENDDAVTNINSLALDFFSFIINEIDTRFGIGIDIDFSDADQAAEIGTALYSFLILRYKKNVTKFLFRYIMKNKKRIVEDFGASKRKDVTTNSLKKKIKNKDDVLIISNLPDITSFIMNMEIDTSDFIKYSCGEGYYEGMVLRNLIDSGQLVGEFVEEYFSLIQNNYDFVLDEIQTDVKLKIMNKG